MLFASATLIKEISCHMFRFINKRKWEGLEITLNGSQNIFSHGNIAAANLILVIKLFYIKVLFKDDELKLALNTISL